MRIFGLDIMTVSRRQAERDHFRRLLDGHRERLRTLRTNIAAERKEHQRKERMSVADIKTLNTQNLKLRGRIIQLRGGKVPL